MLDSQHAASKSKCKRKWHLEQPIGQSGHGYGYGAQHVRSQAEADDRVAEGESGEGIEWPAAANVIKSTPPVIGRKADSKGQRQSVASRAQSAMSAAHSVGQEQQQQQQQRGQALDPDVVVDGDERSEDALAADIQPGPPLIGGVRERRPLRASSTAHHTAPKQGMSRFAARRQLDRELHAGAGADARSHAAKRHSSVDLQHSAAQHVQSMASASAAAAAAAAAAPSSAPQDTSDHDWLEEDGRPMSMFRRNILLSAGLGPPRRAQNVQGSSSTGRQRASSHAPSLAGADDGVDLHNEAATSRILKEVDEENEKVVKGMSEEDVKRELDSLRQHFGQGVLELLSKRKSGATTSQVQSEPRHDPRSEHAREESALHPDLSRSTKKKVAFAQADPDEAPKDDGTLDSIRQTYFPEEDAHRPELEWMRGDSPFSKVEPSADHQLRFGFDGRVIAPHEERIGEGLHHHADESDRAGYTAEELLHLARSTVPSQRLIALTTLGRILELHPVASRNTAAAKHLEHHHIRNRTALISTWLLRDRQMGVRRMALFALRCALRTTKRGGEAMLCVQPPLVSASSSKKIEMYEETIKRDMTRGLLNLAAPTLLVEMYGQDTESGMEIVEDVLDCLCALAEASLDAARAVLQSAGIMDLINSSHALRASPPSLKVLQLLQLLSSVDRQAAAALANATSAHLLRLVALPCWTSAGRAQDLQAHCAFVSTLVIFSIYAQFGVGLEHVVHSWAVFEQLTAHVQYRLEGRTSMDKEESRAAGKMLRLMKAWIICARHPHRTKPQHALGWPHIGEWAELALSVVCNVRAELATPDEEEQAFVLQGCAAGLLDVWIDLACSNARTADAAKPLAARLKDDADAIARLAQSAESAMLAAASRIARLDTLQRQTVEEFVEMLEACKDVVALFERCEAVSALQGMHKASRDLMRDGRLWTRFDEQDAWIAGYRVARHVAAELQGRILESLHGADEEKVDLAEIVELVHSLDKGQEELAQQLVHVIQRNTRTTSLAPFMNESLRVKSSAAVMQGNGTLRGAATLWSTLQARGDEQIVQPGAEEQAEADPEDLDPLTGALLYKSSQSGLPLRSDWTLQALDDLLHSGTCAALNRKDVLPASWDYTEAQLVRDALHLTRMALQATLDTKRHDCSMTASELLLAMCKVFLLERDDAPTPQSTGDITGRNLFRDKEISGALVQLFEMLPQLVASHADTNVQMSDEVAPFDGTRTRSKTMEEAACKETIAVPFYQIYTDLLGLYDGLSLGDEAFQRIILAGQSMLYASDYRRLLWIDHAHLLSTFTLQLRDAPLETLHGLQSYLYPAERDPDVLRAFAAALMRGDVTKTRTPTLHRIATHHVALAAWAADAHGDNAKAAISTSDLLIRTIFAPAILADREAPACKLAKELLLLLLLRVEKEEEVVGTSLDWKLQRIANVLGKEVETAWRAICAEEGMN
ncbi:hypothetical protein IE81DRAFT_340203 [Ceraceosorus guamensis]|uniref:RNA polymerase II-associated protein 1 C-terminal domain-containing protein n=1 Tax=Ceraceosorus guamensis TaxID=1522189 RepID=A0A316W8U7_9BASI|nr:hypothetical protein IE81DRAFT_340203 [Ceraceosorus guamensis]PWN44125.1 hypothetical protein IE81DRAFT_340203 [Ceraceosorus guamensis]